MNIVEYTEFLVKSLVEDPDMIKVQEFKEDEFTIIEVMVPEADMKYVIGKAGKNAHALRTLVYAYAYIHKMHKIKLNNEAIEEIQEDTTITQNQILTLSEQNRDSAVNAVLLFDNVYFQVIDDCADIKSSLQEAAILGLEDSYSQLWRLADNTWRQTTIAEAKQIVALFVARKQEVWAAFAEWDSGNKTEVFVYNVENSGI